MLNRTMVGTVAAGATLLAAVTSGTMAADAPPVTPVKMPLKQARQTVSMLNDLYVTTVLGVHGTYVKDTKTVAAATVARSVFKSMEAKGWPRTRWISTTGRPLNPDATPKDQFEKDAIVALKQGKPRFERVEGGNLRVATLVPLVDQSCIMCHPKDKVGDPIGGLSYTVALSAGK